MLLTYDLRQLVNSVKGLITLGHNMLIAVRWQEPVIEYTVAGIRQDEAHERAHFLRSTKK